MNTKRMLSVVVTATCLMSACATAPNHWAGKKELEEKQVIEAAYPPGKANNTCDPTAMVCPATSFNVIRNKDGSCSVVLKISRTEIHRGQVAEFTMANVLPTDRHIRFQQVDPKSSAPVRGIDILDPDHPGPDGTPLPIDPASGDAPFNTPGGSEHTYRWTATQKWRHREWPYIVRVEVNSSGGWMQCKPVDPGIVNSF